MLSHITINSEIVWAQRLAISSSTLSSSTQNKLFLLNSKVTIAVLKLLSKITESIGRRETISLYWSLLGEVELAKWKRKSHNWLGVMIIHTQEHCPFQTVDCFYARRFIPNHSSHIYNYMTIVLYGYYLIPSLTDAETEVQRQQVSIHSEITWISS